MKFENSTQVEQKSITLCENLYIELTHVQLQKPLYLDSDLYFNHLN